MSWFQIVPMVAAYLIMALATAYALLLWGEEFQGKGGREVAGMFGLFWPVVLLILPVIGLAKLIGWAAARARRD